MKTSLTLNAFTKKSSLFVALLGAAVFFNSCKNDIDNTTPAIAALTVINAYPTTTPLDFYIGSSRMNNTGIAFGQKLNYFEAYAGNTSVNITATGSLTSIKTKSVTLEGGMYHSLFIIGKTAEDVDYLVLNDTPSAPGENQANIRFVNLSPDAGSLSLELVGDATNKFDDRVFKAATPFIPVTAVKSSFVLRDKASGTVKATLNDVMLAKQKTYTIWAKGLETTTTDAFKLSIQVTEH